MRRTCAVVLAAVVVSVVANPAVAQLATFDDLSGCVPSNNGGILIPNGYSGFNWSNFYVADGPNTAAATGGLGYANGVITPRCIALNGFGAASELSAAAPFTFNGGYFTAAFTNGLSLLVTGFNGATPLFSQGLTLNTTTPQLLNVNWTGLTRVRFESGTGAPGSQFVFDNFRFNNTADPSIGVVPEPATVGLVAGGLVLLGAAVRRRRSTTPA